MSKQDNKDYLSNELINQNYFSRVSESIQDPNKDWVMSNTISDLPPKKKIIKDFRPLYSTISGMEKMDQKDFFYKHFHTNMYDSTFFTSNNVEKVKTLFPGKYTLLSVNGLINIELDSFEQLQEIIISNRSIMNWVLIKESKTPLLIENRKIRLSFITLFIITEKSIRVFLYDQGLLLKDDNIFYSDKKNKSQIGEVKLLPDDFVSLYGNTFYHYKIIPQVKATLRKGIGKFEKTIIRDNGMRYKKNFLLYAPIETIFDVDMNYKVYIQKIQKPKEYLKDWSSQYKSHMNTMINEPDAPNGFQIIIDDQVYIPFAPEEKKKKDIKKENIVVKKKVIDSSYAGTLKQNVSDTAMDTVNDMGEFKWVIIAVIIILLFTGLFILN